LPAAAAWHLPGQLVEGTVEMDVNCPLEPEEIEQGYVLTCQSHPTSEQVVVDDA
jgi:ring-1,2-phenylacetyl-CoA epoxidase subunit PaaE